MNELITPELSQLPAMQINEIKEGVDKIGGYVGMLMAAKKATADQRIIDEVDDQIRKYSALKIRWQMELGRRTSEIEKNAEFHGNQHLGDAQPSGNTKSKSEKLKELGISRQRASENERMASEPDIVEKYIEHVIEQNEIPTTSGALKAIKEKKRADKEAKREEKRQENAEKIETLSTPLEAKGLFQTIVIDPPWDWGDEGDVNQFGRARPDYYTMSIEEIEKLPVGEIADENCHLYLWVTNRSLPKAFRLINAWGFRYVTCITWVKPSIGMGNYFRGDTEQILFAVKGSQPLKRHDVGTHFNAPRGDKHSAKPDAFYNLVETCSFAPYIDIFGRREREGWSVWGENG